MAKSLNLLAVAILLFAESFLSASLAFSANRVDNNNWQAAGKTGEELPDFLKAALEFVPVKAGLKSEQIVALVNREKYLLGYLVTNGCSPKDAKSVILEIQPLAEFSLNKEFPIFVNTSDLMYQKLERAWLKGKYQEEMARIMGSKLWHEWQHAAKQEDEGPALQAQIDLLEGWSRAKILPAVESYVLLKKKDLTRERRTQMAFR